MKENLKLFVKGMVLGISFIIPGVSGGTLAVVMGLYEELIEAISHFYQSWKNFKKYFKFILPIGLGVLTAVCVFSGVIKYGLEKAPVITIMFFLGLILGGIPSLFKKVDFKKYKFSDLIFLLIGIGILFGVTLLKPNGNVVLTDLSFMKIITILLVGILTSATMVVPGISGSFMLMTVGYYEPILGVITELTKFNNVIHNLLVFSPFLVGVALGIVSIAKIIEFLLKKYERKTYFIIFGFVLASIYQVAITIFDYQITSVSLIIGFIIMSLGSIAIYKFFGEN